MRPIPAGLRKYLHRINPKVEFAVEALTVVAEDAIVTKSDWDAATQSPVTTFDSFDEGVVTLKESDALGIDNAVSDGFFANLGTNLPSSTCQSRSDPNTCGTPATYAAFELADLYGRAARLRKFKAYLTRNRAGGADFDGAFRLDLYTLKWYAIVDPITFPGIPVSFTAPRDIGAIVPITDPVFVNAPDTGGPATGWPDWPGPTDTELVTFDLTKTFVIVGDLPIPELRSIEADINQRLYVRRIILARISAVRGTNTNYGWGFNSAVTVKTTANGRLSQVQEKQEYKTSNKLFRKDASPWFIREPDGTEADDQFKGLPRCEFTMAAYPSGTSRIKKQLDLGAVPASAAVVEFGHQFHRPPGTTCQPEVSKDDVSYQVFGDGKTAADLGLPAQQTYFLRFSMVPNANLDTSPTGVQLAVRERSRVDLTDLVRVSGGDYAVDPRTMVGEIRRLSIEVIRDGRRDFKDRASRLAYENHPNKIEIELSIRASLDTVPNRDDWMLIDRFSVIDAESAWGSERFEATSVLEKLKRTIPRQKETAPSSGIFIRQPIVETAVPASQVWGDLLTEAEVPLRNQAAPPVHQLTDPLDGSLFASVLTKTISDPVEAKREVDRIGMIMGGAAITRAGRIMFRRMLEEKTVSVFFGSEEIVLGRTPRNLSERMIEFTVPYAFDLETEEFASEVKSFDGDALTNLGVPTVGRRLGDLDNEAAKYLPDSKHARAVGFPVVRHFGGGVLFPWEFGSVIPHPELEPGDLVTIETDRITARDPIDNREIRGRAHIKAVVAGSNPMGTRFTVWVRSFSDIVNVKNNDGPVKRIPRILSASAYMLGRKLVLVVRAGGGVSSFKWALSKTAFPASGTGTCANIAGFVAVVETGTAFDFGARVFITLSPYADTNCAGVQGWPFKFQFRAGWPGEYKDPSGKKDIVLNGDFEKGLSNWGQITDPTKVSVVVAYKGTKSLRIDERIAGANEVALVDDPADATTGDHYKVRVDPGDVYRFKAIAKVSSAVIDLGFLKWDIDKVLLGSQIVVTWSDTIFTEREAQFEIPFGTHYITPLLRVR